MRATRCAAALFCTLVTVTSLGSGQELRPPASLTQTQVSPDTENEARTKVPALQVVLQKGTLFISARSCTLKQVLEAVRKETGASLDIPTFLDIPIVAVQLGPDDPQRVLGSLLYGTGLNYIVVGSVRGGDKLNIVVALRVEPSINAAPVIAAQPAQAPIAKSESVSPDPASDEANLADEKHEEAPAAKDKAKEAEQEVAADKREQPSEEKTVAADMSTDDIKSSLESSPAISANDRLADLPSNINPAIAALYPGLFSGGAANTGGAFSSTVAAVAAGTPIISQTGPSPRATYNPGGTIPVDATGIPILPSNIPPQMWGIYPPNLMQLINSNTSPPVIPVTPLAPGLPTTTTTGQTVFWDQALQGHQ